MNTRHHARHLLLATLIVLMSACGQKGSLYLPDEPDNRETRFSPANG